MLRSQLIPVERKILAVLFVALLAVAAVTPFISTESDATVIVKDGEGRAFSFDGPVDRIMTIGVGVTATAIGVDALDKIVVCDSYSKTNPDPIFDDLRQYIEEKKIAANGNIYSSGKDQLKADIIDAAEPTKGLFDREKDVVLAVVSPSYKENLSFLHEEGFKNVMYWSSVDDYGDIVDFVETISMVCNGRVDESAGQMRAVSETITETLEKADIARAKAFYVTYSGNAYKVGNVTSITTVMIEAAGGTVITKDPSKEASTIEVSLPALMQDNPGAIIFADSQVFNSEEHLKNLRTMVGNDTRIYGMDPIWNNFSIESAKGVWKMAGCLYPELFSGDMPSADAATDNTLLYAVSAIVAIAILGTVAYVSMRPSMGGPKRKVERRFKLFRSRRFVITLAVIIAITVYCVLLDLSWVSEGRSYTFQEVIDALMGKGTWSSSIIVCDINAPRVVIGIFVGAGLAVTGAAMQAVFKNPLASPYILGLSSGASLGAAISMVFVVPFISSAVSTPALAFITCFLTMVLVYNMARTGGIIRTETLILSGVAVSALLSALVSFLTFIAGEKLEGIVFWSMGNLGNADWGEILFAAPLITVASLLLITQAKNLNVLMLGDAHAMDLGVDVRRTRLFILLLTTVVVSAAVSFVGVIGFIGLVIPHILRILLGPDNRVIMPLSMIAGSCFILICDYLTHVIAPFYGTLPIGVVTSLIGAPLFIYLLIRRKKEVGWN